MKHWFFKRIPALPTLIIVLHDLVMTWLCWSGLLELRQALSRGTLDAPLWSVEVTLVLLAQGIVFWRTGLYRGLWRFASLPDLFNIIKAALAGLLAIILALFLYNRLDAVPRSVLVFYPLVLTVLLGVPRIMYRSWKDHGLAWDAAAQVQQRVLILGAGKTGEMLARELRRNPAYQLIGFLDDGAGLQGRRLQGLPVLGRAADVARIAPEVAAELLVIAIPSLAPAAIRALVEACEHTGLPVRTVPRLDAQMDGHLLPVQLKEIEIEDLLGREPVIPDWHLIRHWLSGTGVLITGAGGSIGSELCRQCARLGARTLVLVEMDELALTRIEGELKARFPDVAVIPVLGNCGDGALMRHALTSAAVAAVLHAAAYKHVPVLEMQLREGIGNNVLATETVVRAALEAKVATFVLISTDKAIAPVNVLGASKRLAEMVCQAIAAGSGMRLLTVRFGNVLDSAGSVVPLFREQIRQGGPVTVTDPEVTRFFMTIAEACQLILQAVAMETVAQAVYTLDMGEPVQIRRLAEQMIRLTGQQPGHDVAIVYTGLRPGEKLHETLFHAEEDYRPTAHPKILQAASRVVDGVQVLHTLALLRAAVAGYDLPAVSKYLHQAVPEFTPQLCPVAANSGNVLLFASSRNSTQVIAGHD